MTDLQKSITDDLIEIETDMGSQVFTWDEEDYPCHVGTHTYSGEFEQGGLVPTNQTQIIVRVYDNSGGEIFPDAILPQVGDAIELDLLAYRLDAIVRDATKSFYTLTLKVVK